MGARARSKSPAAAPPLKATGKAGFGCGVPGVHVAVYLLWSAWLHWEDSSYGGKAFLKYLSDAHAGPGLIGIGGDRAALTTFVVTMVTWHGYGLLQQMMDARPDAPWAVYKTHRKDTITYQQMLPSVLGSARPHVAHRPAFLSVLSI